MTFTNWILFFLIVQVIHFLGTWKLYQKAGRKAWEALVPIYNAYILLKIIQRPVWWIVILFIPIVNVIFLPVLWVETIRSFRKYTTLDTILVIVTLGFYIYYINYFLEVNYNDKRDLGPLNFADDFIGSVTYAVIFATFIHTFFIQPFIIPSSSLEKSLYVGDMLFVSKFHYGARVPRTAVSFPMVHDTIPLIGKKSYFSFPQYPSFRLPGFQKIKHNEIVCFNWPADTVYQFWDKQKRHIDKPMDKRSNYVKRCVGLPGDILEIINGNVIVNSKKLSLHDRQKLQYSYSIFLENDIINSLISDYKIPSSSLPYNKYHQLEKITIDYNTYSKNMQYFSSVKIDLNEYFKKDSISNIQSKLLHIYSIHLDDELYNLIKKDVRIYKVQKNFQPNSISTFPHNQPTWSIDNMGPIKIPKEGEIITLTKENFPLYKRLITVYENNTLEQNGDKFIINGKETKTYTIKQDYYWMMGDNRHGSEDSRYWGFVPFDHILGKPVFIWMSFDQDVPWSKLFDKVRWERVFTTVGSEGKPRSYFIYFLIFVAIWQGYVFYKKKKAKV